MSLTGRTAAYPTQFGKQYVIRTSSGLEYSCEVSIIRTSSKNLAVKAFKK